MQSDGIRIPRHPPPFFIAITLVNLRPLPIRSPHPFHVLGQSSPGLRLDVVKRQEAGQGSMSGCLERCGLLLLHVAHSCCLGGKEWREESGGSKFIVGGIVCGVVCRCEAHDAERRTRQAELQRGSKKGEVGKLDDRLYDTYIYRTPM